MKKISLIFVFLLIVSCASQSEKMQTEYFKDFQAQVLALSQRVDLLETRIKKDITLKGEVYDRLDKIDDKILSIDKNLNKIKNHPLFEGLESVKLTEVPSSTVITIKPETVTTNSDASEKFTQQEDLPKKQETVQTVEFQEEQKTVQSMHAQPAKKEIANKIENPASDLYNKGYEMYHVGKYPQAISIFREFLQKYAKDALADNAQYWIAESYYAQKLFDKAIKEFKKVENYPDGNKVPDAYLKIVYSYLELGKKKDAVKWKDALLKKYKDSEAAKKLE